MKRSREFDLVRRVAGRMRQTWRTCERYGLARGLAVVARFELSRLTGRAYVDVPLPDGQYTVHLRATRRNSDVSTFSQIFIEQEYDLRPFLQMERLQKRAGAGPPTIIDCGANVGCSVLWFASQFPGAHIVAVEPEAANFALLERNARDVPNVTFLQAAIWSSNTEIAVRGGRGTQGWAFRTSELNQSPADSPVVPGVTIASLLDRVNTSGPVIVKIDVEGAEDEIFRNQTEWLERIDLLIVELHDWMLPWRGTSRNLFRAMADLPFDYCMRGENLFCFLDRTAVLV